MTSKVINEIIVFKRGDSNVSRMSRFDNYFIFRTEHGYLKLKIIGFAVYSQLSKAYLRI